MDFSKNTFSLYKFLHFVNSKHVWTRSNFRSINQNFNVSTLTRIETKIRNLQSTTQTKFAQNFRGYYRSNPSNFPFYYPFVAE